MPLILKKPENKKLKIGVNLLVLYELTGIGVYAKNLLDNLGKIDNKNQFLIFVSEKIFPEVAFDYRNFQYIKIPINLNSQLLKFFAQQILLPLYLIRYKCDILFTPSTLMPLFYPSKKQVVTIHDLGYLNNKKKKFKHFYLKILTQKALRSARIITISNFAKSEIMKFASIPEDKIKIIYRTVPFINIPTTAEEQKILSKFNIKNPYFFYVGIIEQSKNIENLIKAFKIFNSKYPDVHLILAGGMRPESFDVQKIIKDLNLEEKIILPGFITEKEKAALYKNSIAFLFPSLHEGFGLPMLEGQSLGVPVLTSNVTSLPEVGGDSVMYVNPYDVDDIAKGMERLFLDENLRKQLIEKGFQNIKRFTPEKETKETLEIFQEVVNRENKE